MNQGSSRISVKSTKFCDYPEFEVDEILVSESDAYCYPQSIIDALDEPIGNSFDASS
jgi:hypothetical protein